MMRSTKRNRNPETVAPSPAGLRIGRLPVPPRWNKSYRDAVRPLFSFFKIAEDVLIENEVDHDNAVSEFLNLMPHNGLPR